MADFNKKFARMVEEANETLRIYAILEEKGYQKTVIEAMNYSINAGGKRLRPVMMKACFDLFDGEGEIIRPFMAAIEQIHTYSLVHDDLPAMDNDELRRGLATTHVKYKEHMAILAGDALLNHAFETAFTAFDCARSLEEYKRVEKALKVLGNKAGVFGMIGGQTADVEAEKEAIPMDADRLDFIFRLKTGALIEASMMIGAILAGASDEDVRTIETIAGKVGIAFQIRDDILDVYGTEEELGKPIGSDEKNNKVTYVTFAGAQKSQEDVERLSDEAKALLKALERDTEFLEKLIESLIERTK